MTSPWTTTLDELVTGIEFDDSGNILWFGSRIGAKTMSAITPDETLTDFARHLYLHAYAFGRIVKGPLAARPRSRREADELLAKLRGCTRGRGREVVAQVLSVSRDQRMIVDWRGIRMTVGQDRADLEAKSGRARVNIGSEMRRPQRGAYVVLSDREPAAFAPEIRLYWHIREGSLPALVDLVTERLNHALVPFSLKVMLASFAGPRCDAAILYLPVSAFVAHRHTIADVHAELPGGALAPEVPLWTRRLADGLGVAASPHDGTSFGELRTRHLAVAIMAAGRVYRHAGAMHPDSVRDHLQALGWDLERTHLLPESDPHLDHELWIY